MKHYLSVSDFVVIFNLIDRAIKNREQPLSMDLFNFYGEKDRRNKKRTY